MGGLELKEIQTYKKQALPLFNIYFMDQGSVDNVGSRFARFMSAGKNTAKVADPITSFLP